MSDESTILQPLPYHDEIVRYLQAEQSELWKWFADQRLGREHVESVRLELLKTAYRIDAESSSRLHELAHEASRRLDLDVPITLYHSQRLMEGLNAYLAFLPDEVHIVLHGPVTDVLDEHELKALLGHELSHFRLWTADDGRYFIADQMLAALADDEAADTPQTESRRMFRLYTEIFCDRGGRLACGDLLPTIGTLVKTETGVRDVNASSYLKQAQEIAGRDPSKAAGLTHPECYIRARALQLWDENESEADGEIRRMIEGQPVLQELDLLAQRRIGDLTRWLVDAYLSHTWLRTEPLLGHARLFFDGYDAPAKKRDEALADDLNTDDTHLRDYYCYVLLDFVTTDRDLDDAPLAAAFLLTDRLGLSDRLAEIVRKELGVRKKQLDKLRGDAEAIVARAGREVAAK